jgi:hypothetical protein
MSKISHPAQPLNPSHPKIAHRTTRYSSLTMRRRPHPAEAKLTSKILKENPN